MDASKTPDERVNLLLPEMTMDEKVNQLLHVWVRIKPIVLRCSAALLTVEHKVAHSRLMLLVILRSFYTERGVFQLQVRGAHHMVWLPRS
jgi:hypothetical protein